MVDEDAGAFLEVGGLGAAAEDAGDGAVAEAFGEALVGDAGHEAVHLGAGRDEGVFGLEEEVVALEGVGDVEGLCLDVDNAEVGEEDGFVVDFHDDAVVWWEKALKLNPDSEILNRKVKNKTYFHK